jgi:TatD DNase family protein
MDYGIFFPTTILINLENRVICALINNMKIIDVHSHIEYITHNFQDDVVGTVCCATQEFDWDVLAKMIQTDKNIYGAFGIHPWFVDSVKDGFEERLESLLKTNKNYMVGEIGLDKYKPNMEKQIGLFQKQFDIAIRLKRTMFLHCVGAWDKILHILKQHKQSELPIIVLHDFNANVDVLTKLLKYKQIYFSLGKNVVRDRLCCVQEIPSDRILVETDADKNILLIDVINKISQNESDIYNNTLKVLNNEQIA